MRARALLTMTAVLAGCAVVTTDAMADNGGAAYGAPTADTRVATQQATPTPTPTPAPAPPAQPGQVGAVSPAPPAPVAGSVATVDPTTGLAAPPVNAPPAVQNAIIAANQIIGKPYRYGGGHRPGFLDPRGYDCSGTVSFALHAAGLLASPLDSGTLMRWGARGRGHWITVYTNAGHAYAVIAGLRLDTSAYGVARAAGVKAAESGPRWRPTRRPAVGFVRRHPAGL